jgi:D-alanyl-D-alanine carboxypeptidase (penicillin-binding protein 5/6)
MFFRTTAGSTRVLALALSLLFIFQPLGSAQTNTQANNNPKSSTNSQTNNPQGIVVLPPPPIVEAGSAVLMEAASGQVLFSKNPHEQKPQASTTKITTAIVALEKGKLTDIVKISKQAAETLEAAIWLAEGEELTLEQLMYALLLFSANDAASAIAEHIEGSEEQFVAMMNAKAQEIGAKDSHYVNPHGLDRPEHYSSAYDLAILARYGLTKVPGFAQLVRTREKSIPWDGHHYLRVLRNRNKLLKSYPGADGVKTGFTNKAGRCLVASATRGNMQLIAVVMDSPNMFRETAAMLDWGFANYTKQELVIRDRTIRPIRVINGLSGWVNAKASREVILALTPEAAAKLKMETILAESLEAPVVKDQKLGVILISPPGQPQITVDLLSASSIARKSRWQLFWEYLKNWFS